MEALHTPRLALTTAMKLFSRLLLFVFLSNAAFCGTYQVASPVPVTVALTEKFSMGALYQRDETGKEDKTQPLTDRVEYSVEAKDGTSKSHDQFGRKALTFKVGNREVIQFMTGSEETKGLTIMALPYIDIDRASLTYFVYVYDTISKKVSKELFSIDVGTAMTGAGSEVKNINAQGETVSVTASGSAAFESVVTISYDGLGLTGLFTGGAALKTYLPDPKDKTSLDAVGIPGASKISGIVGGVEGDYFIGTISFGASKAIVITTP